MRSASPIIVIASAALALAAPPPIAQPQGRAFTDGSYAPYAVTCPSNITWVRASYGLSAGEQSYLDQRNKLISSPINTQLAAHGIATPPRTPVISYALSGGGLRALQVGLGGVEATMNASSEAAASGIGGWYDGVTYMAGLSGGSWGTMNFIVNNGVLPSSQIASFWDFESNLVFPDDDKISFYADLLSETNAKGDVGFPTQLTDLWGLAVADHIFPDQYRLSNSPNLTFSSFPTLLPGLANGSLPFPIIISAERQEGEQVIAENATIWEFTPYEFGSWAFGSTTKVPGAFTPLEYLGSSVSNAMANGTCYKGFDQASFIIGSSATLFNGLALELNDTSSSVVTTAIKALTDKLSSEEDDVSQVPNMFANWNTSNNPISDLEYITLVDAGETNQNLPIEPLLVPNRNVDAIIAFDSSADTTYSWPNGSALYTTYTRAQLLAENEDVMIRMPAVPSTAGFVNGGLNTRPTFFGCNDTTTPVIVYIPNYPWSYGGNTSTFMLSYTADESNGVLFNGLRSLSLNGSVPTWPKCFACALSDRSFGYTASNRTADCQSCFDTWCWNGVDNTTQPIEYEPVIGSVPAWLTAQGLVNTTNTDAPGVASTSTSAAATSSTSAKTSGAEKVWKVGGWVVAFVALVTYSI